MQKPSGIVDKTSSNQANQNTGSQNATNGDQVAASAPVQALENGKKDGAQGNNASASGHRGSGNGSSTNKKELRASSVVPAADAVDEKRKISEPASQILSQASQKAAGAGVPAEGSQAPQVYCICKSTDETNMIQCDRCEEWYHFQCVGILPVSQFFQSICLNQQWFGAFQCGGR